MSRVFWDSNLFIYLFEDLGILADAVERLFQASRKRGDRIFTSAIVLGEVLVRPLEQGNRQLADWYAEAMATWATLLPFDERAAWVFAQLRRDRALRAPDAMNLACAAAAGMDLFITNDARLCGKTVPGIQFIVPLDRVPL